MKLNEQGRLFNNTTLHDPNTPHIYFYFI